MVAGPARIPSRSHGGIASRIICQCYRLARYSAARTSGLLVRAFLAVRRTVASRKPAARTRRGKRRPPSRPQFTQTSSEDPVAAAPALDRVTPAPRQRPCPRAQNTRQFAEDRRPRRVQIEDAIHQRHVDRPAPQRQPFGSGQCERRVARIRGPRGGTRPAEHRLAEIHAVYSAGHAHAPGGDQAIKPGAAAQIQNGVARAQFGEDRHIGNAGERVDRAFWNAFEQILRYPKLCAKPRPTGNACARSGCTDAAE